MSKIPKPVHDGVGYKTTRLFMQDDDGNLVPVVHVAGSIPTIGGKIADRPAADEVEVPTVYWAVDRIGEADEFSVSDGSTWVNV